MLSLMPWADEDLAIIAEAVLDFPLVRVAVRLPCLARASGS